MAGISTFKCPEGNSPGFEQLGSSKQLGRAWLLLCVRLQFFPLICICFMLPGVAITLPGEMICKINIQLHVFSRFWIVFLIGDSTHLYWVSHQQLKKEIPKKQQKLKNEVFLKHCSQASSDSWPVLLTVSKYVALTCPQLSTPPSFIDVVSPEW